MSATFSMRLAKDNKKYFDDTLNEIADTNKEISRKEDALKYMLDVFNNKKISVGVEELEADIAHTIKTIDCKYLRYEGTLTGFICHEFFFSKKKGSPIGSDPYLVVQRCMDCKQGKEDDRQKRVALFLQKDSMKKIMNLRAVLMTYVDQGFDVQTYICKAGLLHESALYVSYDGKRLPCFQQDMEVMNIEETCKNVINTRTNQPPCEHLIDLFHRAVMKKFEEAIVELEKALPALAAPLTGEETTTPTQEIKEAENVEVSASDTSKLDEPIEPKEESIEEKTDKKKEKKKGKEK